jgi:hypothetical protein
MLATLLLDVLRDELPKARLQIFRFRALGVLRFRAARVQRWLRW